MAPGMKRWVGIVAVGAVALSWMLVAWADSAIEEYAARESSLRNEYFTALFEESSVARALMNVRLLDRIRAAADGDTLLLLGGAERMRVGDGFRDDVARDLAGTGDRVDVAVAVAPGDWLIRDTARRRVRIIGGPEYLLVEGDDPLCAAVMLPTAPWEREDWVVSRLRPGRMLGPCWWVSRYGPPSDSIAAWLVRGGGRFARTYGDADSRPPRVIPSPVRLLGARTPTGLTLAEEACVKGDDAACEKAVSAWSVTYYFDRYRSAGFDPADPTLFSVSYARRPAFAGVGDDFLADLETAVGPEAFRQFWTSERGVIAAMSDAAGRPAGEWVRDWVADRIETQPTRAAIGAGDWLLSLLALGILAGFAILLARRKRA